MGSRLKIHLAYIAGFLDGDGSLMLQIKKRKDCKKRFRFMPTICFYQDTRHEKPLLWIRKFFGIGYISRRNDGMTELRINGYEQVKRIITSLLPFIKFKKLQAKALCSACHTLSNHLMNQRVLLSLVDKILLIQNENYVTKRKKTKKELCKILSLTP